MSETKEIRQRAVSGAVCKPLQIVIPCSNHELDRVALRVTAGMASDLNAKVTLVYVGVVPFPRHWIGPTSTESISDCGCGRNHTSRGQIPGPSSGGI